MIIFVDIDNTICYSSNLDYTKAIPNYENIKKVNNLYKNNTIVMWTARGTLSNKNWFKITYQQLLNWKVNFHELRMGKPAFDIFIDDKALNSIYHWNNINVYQILYPSKKHFTIVKNTFV